jgi:HlyD family secretion protein
MKESDKIELRSDEVQEILSRPPHALVRYGISVICGVLLILFIGSFFFKYPDIVRGDVVITTENPPVWLVAKSSGKIKELLCTDKQPVRQGDVLAVIENSASTADMLAMRQLLSGVYISETDIQIPPGLLTTAFELGEVQSVFSAFTRAAMNYENFLSLNLINQEKTSLSRQLADRKNYSTNLQKQLEMKKRELKIAKSDYEREKKLFQNKVISEYEMEKAEQSFLNKEQELQQVATSISMEEFQSSQMKGSVGKLSVQYQQEKNLLLSELKSAHNELLSSVEKWEQAYLLIAPQSGVVTFNSFWKQNQNISVGNKVFAIISRRPGQLLGKIKIPVSGSGKIQNGQLVNIKVANYPYMEYGLLQGRIRNISLVTTDNYYTLEVSLSNGLRTSINRELKFTGELIGSAEIITENRNLIERIYSPLRYLINKSL